MGRTEIPLGSSALKKWSPALTLAGGSLGDRPTVHASWLNSESVCVLVEYSDDRRDLKRYNESVFRRYFSRVISGAFESTRRAYGIRYTRLIR